MVEGKDLESVDMMFPFLAEFVDLSSGYIQAGPMTQVHIIYTELLNKLAKDWNEDEVSLDML